MRAVESQVALDGIHSSVVRLLGRRIVSGELRPGEILPEQAELSRQLGISRTVLREATKTLAAKGLLESRPKRGTVVLPRSCWRLLDPDVLAWETESGLSEQFLDSVFEVRLVIEPAAARFAAERATADEIAAIREAFEEMAACTDEQSYLDADLRYHLTMVETTHNDYLIQLAGVFTAALQAAIKASLTETGRGGRRDWSDFMDFSIPLHGSVLEAIESNDPERAETLMRQLVERSRQGTIEASHAAKASRPSRALDSRRRKASGPAA